MKITNRILNIHHNDLDGVVCSILLGNVFKHVSYIDVNFYDLDNLLKHVEYSKYEHVILTDVHPKNKESLYISDKIMLLDHHNSALEYNSSSKNLHVVVGNCGAWLVKDFLEKEMNIDLSKFDELVKYTNDYDMWIHKYEKSWELNEIFFMYYRMQFNCNSFRNRFLNGEIKFTDIELEYLNARKKELEQIKKNLEIFEFDNIKACLIQVDDYVNDACDYVLKNFDYNVVFCLQPKSVRLSVRGNLENVDIGLVLKDLGFGGGHATAAGMNGNNLNELKNRLPKTIEELLNRYPQLAK